MTNHFDRAVQVTQCVQKTAGIPVVWGGIHPTVRPEECLQYADVVCIGEGESSIVELAARIDNGEGRRNIPGIWAKDSQGIIKNPLPPLIQDLDALPFPDYDCDTNYILRGQDFLRLSADVFAIEAADYHTLCTRGCPHNCA
ncbi:unnamed protein product, partial [marine sediment metagenome]